MAGMRGWSDEDVGFAALGVAHYVKSVAGGIDKELAEDLANIIEEAGLRLIREKKTTVTVNNYVIKESKNV